MRDNKKGNDSFRPFAAGILYSFKRGLYLSDGTCVVPELASLAASLPALRSAQSTAAAKQLQSSSHRGICSFHRSISSVAQMPEGEAPLEPPQPAPFSEADPEYKVFSTEHDEEIAAADLAEPIELERLRAYLDQQLEPLKGAASFIGTWQLGGPESAGPRGVLSLLRRTRTPN